MRKVIGLTKHPASFGDFSKLFHYENSCGESHPASGLSEVAGDSSELNSRSQWHRFRTSIAGLARLVRSGLRAHLAF